VKIRSDLYVRVYEALGEAGIEIPFPQQDLHLRSVSVDAGAVLAGRRPGDDAVEKTPPASAPTPPGAGPAA
jgi:potassium-dependent mechanosensitive channel